MCRFRVLLRDSIRHRIQPFKHCSSQAGAFPGQSPWSAHSRDPLSGFTMTHCQQIRGLLDPVSPVTGTI